MREPMLDELLEEPIIRKVMLADGYSADDIRLLVTQAGARAGFPVRSGPRDFKGFAVLGCCASRAAASPEPN